MAERIFENVSPFGDMLVFDREVKKGDRFTVRDNDDADRLALDETNWREIKPVAKTPAKKAPEA